MNSVDYDELPFHVRSDFADSHSRFWRRLSGPGSWWTGEERVAMAREVRAAALCPLCRERKAAISPYSHGGQHQSASSRLPEAAIDIVHRIVTDASRLTGSWFEGVAEQGISDGHYVEIVGTVVSVVSIDAFCRAIGAPLHALPEPRDGEPDRYRPASAEKEAAWLPVVPVDNCSTPEADLWSSERTGWVVRAMSLVPEEVRTLSDLSGAHYLPMSDVANPSASQGCLSRSQIELVAGRVSAINECFY